MKEVARVLAQGAGELPTNDGRDLLRDLLGLPFAQFGEGCLIGGLSDYIRLPQ
jgi:hypothetical protein